MFSTIDIVCIGVFFSEICRIKSRPCTGLNQPINFLNVFKCEAHFRIQYCAVSLAIRIFSDCDRMRLYFWEVICNSITQDFWFSDSQPGCTLNPRGALKTSVCRSYLQTNWIRISGGETLASDSLKLPSDSKVQQGLRTIDLVRQQWCEVYKQEKQRENGHVALMGFKHILA